jgi:CheY-like chemotaxis protein
MTQSTVEANVRLLVVDNDVDTVETTALLFQLEGYETRTAEDGAEAIELAKAFHPDVVLLDLGVPEMNGYEVARELRRIDTTKNSLIVAVTGFAQPIDELRSAEADFDLHFVKPVDFAVIEHVRLLLAESNGLVHRSRGLATERGRAFVTLVGLAVDMANTFLDVAGNASNAEFKRRCVAKAQSTHGKMLIQVQRNAPDRTELTDALAALKQRSDGLWL